MSVIPALAFAGVSLCPRRRVLVDAKAGSRNPVISHKYNLSLIIENLLIFLIFLLFLYYFREKSEVIFYRIEVFVKFLKSFSLRINL